ncbi:galactosylgalactosylxylosylprotein 3-beta-glucuronosyltransferase I-like isoform X2 [Arctopsyche grandis]|uniref:galactosylgalactosylxylosylprotein 3-beta-glucuronosyltransferase I-like isoform X2 n=1 Tax=Arctopsyche grandis TaxID=121162 RepID=UPI00406D71A0
MTADIRIRRRTLVLYSALLCLALLAFVSTNSSFQCSDTSGVGAGVSHTRGADADADPPSALPPLPRPQPLTHTRSGCVPRERQHDPDLPMIYAITPTYTRPVQKAELTRLAQTLMWLDNFHWIVVEDSDTKTPLVESFLLQTNLEYTHLVARTKKNKQLKPTARGVEQRNAGLDWLRKNLHNDDQLNGVVFFMDDDNTYSLQIFEEMRLVRKVGVWPVGLVGGMMVERPLVDSSGTKVLGFNSVWRPERPFPIDMAGFAINLHLLKKHPNAVFTHKVQAGYQESEILRQLITKDELEPLADKCTKVYVWHTRTEKPKMNEENKLRAKNPKGSNDGLEV